MDLNYSSVGATCAPFDGTLPADYEQPLCPDHDHISPDLKIDASTCALPESTWFIKNASHLEMLTGSTEIDEPLIDFILCAEGQPTVWDRAEYPQFLICTESHELEPMTAENDYSKLGDYKKPAFFARFRNFFADVKKLFSLLFAVIKGGAS